MRYNIFVKLLFPVILALLASSCTEKYDPETPTGRVVSVPAATNGKVNIDLTCTSNLQSYVLVSYAVDGLDDVERYGNFHLLESSSFSWTAAQGIIKLALKAEKIRSVPFTFFEADEGVTFDLQATITTPTDGVQLNWGAVFAQHYSSDAQIWLNTGYALNNGKWGQTPGLGADKFILITIGKNSYGDYGISLDWKAGNIFYEFD